MTRLQLLLALAALGTVACVGLAALVAAVAWAVTKAVQPGADDARIRADVTALKLEHDKVVEQLTRWNKKRNPQGVEPSEPATAAANGSVNPRHVQLELIKRRIAAAAAGRK